MRGRGVLRQCLGASLLLSQPFFLLRLKWLQRQILGRLRELRIIFLGGAFEECAQSVHAFVHGGLNAFLRCAGTKRHAAVFDSFGEINEFLRRIFVSIEEDVFDQHLEGGSISS